MKKFYEFKNILDTTAEFYIFSEIVSDELMKWSNEDVCPKDMVEAINSTKGKTLNVHINSPGGNCFAGLAIYNLLKTRTDKTVCYIDGIAASAASIIAMAGDEIVMPKNSFIMIHKPIKAEYGNSDTFRKAADELDKLEDSILQVYKSKLISEDEYETIKTMISDETWLSAEDVKTYFKDITIIEENKAIAKFEAESYKNYKKVPAEVIKVKDRIPDNYKDEILKMKIQLELLEA